MERPNSKGSQNFIVGLFVFVALMVSAGFVVFMGGSLNLAGEFQVKTSFMDVRGLSVGAPVYLSGVKIGRVTEIIFVDSQSGGKPELLVTMTLETRYQDRVREDAMVTISTQGVLGDKVVMVDAGSTNVAAVAHGAVLKSYLPGELSDYLSKGGDLVSEIKNFVKSLNSITNSVSNDPKVSRVIANVDRLTASLATSAQKFEKDEDVKAAVSSLKNILKKVDEGQGTLGALVNDASLYEDMRILLGGAQRSTAVRFLIRQAISNSEEKEKKGK